MGKSISTFDLEKKLLGEGWDFVIGIDEAGRGPLAGPVVAVATTVRNFQFPRLPAPDDADNGGQAISNFQKNSNDQTLPTGRQVSNDKSWDLIRDSKALSHKQREEVFEFVHENFFVGVGICDHQTIDRMNILEATYLAAKKAIGFLMREISKSQSRVLGTISKQYSNTNDQISKQNHKFIILFDGNKNIPNLSLEQKTVVNGDKIVKSISAASIVAKVTRDRIMMEMHEKYPQYCFDKHKGYGTKLHMECLQKYGPSEIHRRSFAPVRKSLLKG